MNEDLLNEMIDILWPKLDAGENKRELRDEFICAIDNALDSWYKKTAYRFHTKDGLWIEHFRTEDEAFGAAENATDEGSCFIEKWIGSSFHAWDIQKQEWV